MANRSKKGKGFSKKSGNKRFEKNKSDRTTDGIKYDKYPDDTKNDPTWYNRFPELTKVATTVSWNVTLGAPISIDPNYTGTTLGSWEPAKEMGLFTVAWIPTFGVGESYGDPVNKAALEIWSQIRRNKSGNPGFDRADIIQYLIALDSLNIVVTMMKRAYGAMNLISPVNRYVPRYILTNSGLNSEDWFDHKADVLALTNLLTIQMGKFCIPANMHIFDRHEQLSRYLYKDEPIDRASLFMYVPEMVWKYDEATATCIPQEILKNHDTSSTRWTYADWKAMAYDLLERIQQVQDFATMNANFLDAYGLEGCRKWYTIPDVELTYPDFREEMLMQMHNTTFVGNDWDPSTMIVTQDQAQGSSNKGAVVFKPVFKVTTPTSGYEQFLDIPFDSPSTDDILEASRLKVCTRLTDGAAADTWNAEVRTCGSEIPTRFKVLFFSRLHNPGAAWSVKTITLMDSGAVDQTSYARALTKLNMAPQVIVFEKTDGVYYPEWIYGDLTNFAVVEEDNLRNMHEAAMYSELAVSRGTLA